MHAVLGHAHLLALLPSLKAQSLLFSGPPSVGRRAVARWWMYGLNCQEGFPPCGRCPSCRTPIDNHPDYREIGPELATKSGKVARKPQIRLEQIAPREDGGESLLEWMTTYPRYRAKVAVINEAHTLGEPAANALLKLLEEPPAYARLVLIAPSREMVLPTLASRSLELTFGPLPEPLLHSLSQDPPLLAYAAGAPGKLYQALENPLEFQKLQARLEGVHEALSQGPAPTQEALKALWDSEDGLALLAQTLQTRFPTDHPQRKAVLEAIATAQEAHGAYVNEEISSTWLALRLWRLANQS